MVHWPSDQRLAYLGNDFRNYVRRANGHIEFKITPVSESTYLLHTDPVVFPEPHTFPPERWAEASSEQKQQMRKHFAPFSKGSRQCIGMK
jgi:hypothetical protein